MSTASSFRNSSSISAGAAPAEIRLRRSAWNARLSFSNASLSQGVGSGVPFVTRSRHLRRAGSFSAVTFGSHGSGRSAAPVSYATSEV